MKYRRIHSRPELLCDQASHCVVDPDGNYIGWDGPIFPDGLQVSTLDRPVLVTALPVTDTRRL